MRYNHINTVSLGDNKYFTRLTDQSFELRTYSNDGLNICTNISIENMERMIAFVAGEIYYEKPMRVAGGSKE